MYKKSIPENPRTLQDISKNGKERPWRKHKKESMGLKEAYDRLGMDDRAVRVAMCGSRLLFRVCDQGHKRLKAGMFCQLPLCTMCAWRRSLLIFAQVNDILHESMKREKLRFLFLTLTCRNVPGYELADTLDMLFKAWTSLSRRKKFKNSVVGWFRALEITHKMHADQYHPHFHVILAVRPSYFTHGYIKQSEWVEMWQASMNVDYTPIVDIRVARAKKKGQGIESAVAEISKYAVKGEDYIDPSDEAGTDLAVETLDSALKGRRLIGFGGLFRKVRRDLKQVDAEKADLVKINDDDTEEECNCEICGGIMVEVIYQWHVGLRNYVEVDE